MNYARLKTNCSILHAAAHIAFCLLLGLVLFCGMCSSAFAEDVEATDTLTYAPDSNPSYRDSYCDGQDDLSSGIGTLSLSTASPARFAAAFLTATFEACETSATLPNASDLGITKEALSQGYQIAMDDPRYFYVDKTIRYGFSSDGKKLVVKPNYLWDTKAKIRAAKTQLYDAVADALTWVDGKAMSDVELAQALHDYLVRYCIYDKRSAMGEENWIAHTAYGALVNHSTVCQGYSAAYKLLLNQVGVPCVYVISIEHNHGWNMVRIGGSWYHVDITGDDPAVSQNNYAIYYDGGFDGAVSHKYFLKSDATIASDGKHNPWSCSYSALKDCAISSYPEYKGPVSKEYAYVPGTGIAASLSSNSFTYNGSAFRPEVSLSQGYSNGTSQTIDPTEYSVQYVNNVNAGTGLAVVTCSSRLENPLIVKFTIKKAPLVSASATLKTKSYTYSGSAKRPKFKSVVVNGRSLSSSQYSVSYSSNKKVGTASAVVSFNNYSGSITKTFKINPKTVVVKSVLPGYKSFNVKWKNKTSPGTVSGYQIRYSTSKSMAHAKNKKASKKATSKTVASLKSGKKYYVQVRTYAVVNGKTYFSSWSKKKSVRTW